MTGWTKASRGGEGAGKRGQVPEAAALPLTAGYPSVSAGKYPLFLHRLNYGETSGYKAFSRLSWSEVEADVTQDILDDERVRMTFNGEKLTVDYNWRGTFGSYALKAPQRQAFLQKALQLRVGQWGRVLYNDRRGSYGYEDSTWNYSEHILNIGLFINPQTDVFLTSPPIKTYTKMADLW